MTQTIDITLNSEIVSVDGVVNGERYAFTLTGTVDDMSIWSATVPRSEDNIYRVVLTVTCVRERCVPTLSTTLYYGLHLITDRTQFDVDRVNMLSRKMWHEMTPEEQSEWDMGLKGAYNCTDLNRVYAAVRYLQNRLSDIGYFVNVNDQKTWVVQETPTTKDMSDYLDDIRAIRNVFTLFKTTPLVPDTMVGFTYTKANDIEQILLDVDQLISNTIASFVYSGEFLGGEI